MVMKSNFELALLHVVNFIGSDYGLPDPTAEFIKSVFDGTDLRNPYFGQTPQALKFEMGTQKEVDMWIANASEKYPVMWLVYPDSATMMNKPNSIEAHRRTRFVFAVNNDVVDTNVKARLQTTRVVLENVVDMFLKLMQNSTLTKYIWLDKTTPYTKRFQPNKSSDENETQRTGKSIDPWDVLTLDCDMYIRPSCIPKIVFETETAPEPETEPEA